MMSVHFCSRLLVHRSLFHVAAVVATGLMIGSLCAMHDTSLVLSVAFLLGGSACYVVSYGVHKDVFAPWGLFAVVWLTAVGISNLQLSSLQTEWSADLWGVLLLGGGSFLFGSLLMSVPFLSKKVSGLDTRRPRTDPAAEMNRRRLRRAIQGLFILSVGVYVYEAYHVGGLPLLAENPLQTYINFPLPYIHYVAMSMIPLCSLIGVYFCLYSKPWWMRVMLVVVLLLLLARLARWEVIWAVTGFVSMRHYLGRRWKLRRIIVFVLVLISAAAVLGDVRTVQEGAGYIADISGLDLSPRWNFFAWPYSYFAISIEHLGMEISAIQETKRYTFGRRTALPLLAVMRMKHAIPAEPIAPVLIGGGTATFLSPYYADFGLLGVVVLPFLLGMFVSGVYYLAAISRSRVLWTLVYSMMLMPVLAVGSNAMFVYPAVYVHMGVLMSVYLICKRKRVCQYLVAEVKSPYRTTC